MKTIISFLAGFFLPLAFVTAQQVTIQYELTLQGAQAIMTSALQHADAIDAPGAAISIVDGAGTLVYFERLDGTFPIASEVSLGKARSAALFRFPTVKLEEGINGSRPALLSLGEVSLKGGVPVVYQGKVIGAIGVSGAASADQDVEIAMAGLQASFLQETLK